MSSKGYELLRSWIGKFRKNEPVTTPAVPQQEPSIDLVPLTNPVDEYYNHRTRNNLPMFYRFALQTRSIAIRDVFAKASSTDNLNLDALVNLVQSLNTRAQEENKRSLNSKYDVSTLLALADLLANSARNDLDTYRAVQLYDFVYEFFGVKPFSRQQTLLYIEALSEARYFERAELLARELSIHEIAPLQPELLVLQRIRRGPSASIYDWAQELNELYSNLNMSKIQLLDDESLPLLDRLTAKTVDYVDGPKVSVIMPTFCPGPGIRTALRGLLEQTWQNLEIIVVDDASPAEYQHVFSEISGLDSRVGVIHHEHNAGAYVARNTGLAKATGDFITTADDDDWSHPDKIASHVSVMLDDEQTVASMSEHIRTTEQLEFLRVNQSARFLQLNYSSLMVRQRIVEEIGTWDTVNRGADSEFLMRLRRYYGSDKVAQIRARPLAFSRVWKGSLTSGEMYRGFTATPRLLHVWAIRQWHRDLEEIGEKPMRPVNSIRPYSVPSTFEAGQRGKDLGLFDVIYVTDFFKHAKYVDFALKEMRTLTDRGLRVGYVHLDSPRTTKVAGLPTALLQSQFEGEITQVSLNDVAETRLLMVYDSAVGMFTDESYSGIRSQRSILVEKRLPTLSGAADRFPTDYLQVLSYLDRTFDTYVQIVGATNRDHETVAARVPFSRVLHNSMIWRTHLNECSVKARPPVGKPVVGFHTYGNKYRWPRNSKIFADVYLSDFYETRFTGQLGSAFKKFGNDLFSSARLVDDNDIPTRVFLDGIDFWVYHPDPRLQDDVWEPVLRAMSAGKVVILPPSLKNVYQHGAVYGQPEEIEGIVNELSSNVSDFERQTQLGQSFVNSFFSAGRFYERVSQLLSTTNNDLREPFGESFL